MTHEREHKSLWAINFRLGIKIILSAVKTTLEVIGHSPAFLAERINFTSDAAYYVFAGTFMMPAI
jgi:divalent metal cation (Fe/Co/Zn/Cd) transporter